MVNPSQFRIGNWIHKKGTSRYGVVNGDLLALLEKDEKLREQFKYIELTPIFLIAAGFIEDDSWSEFKKGDWTINFHIHNGTIDYLGERIIEGLVPLHRLQNICHALTEEELPLPDSAKIIPEHAR